MTGASSRGIAEYNLDRGWVEWVQFVTPTRRRWALNYYITQCKGNSISWGSNDLEIRCGRESPGWAAQENGKETRLWPIEWGSICCSSVRSPTPSHTQPFQIKWEVYFSKRMCRSSLLCRRYDFAYICIYADVYAYNRKSEINWILKNSFHWQQNSYFQKFILNCISSLSLTGIILRWGILIWIMKMAQRIEELSLYGSRWALSEDSCFKSYPSRPEVYLVKNVVR